jgi:transposase
VPVIDDDEVYCERVAGMDISKRDVKVAVRLVENGRVKRLKVRTFGTTTRSLLVLRDWLEELDITLVAMESTGVYWKPLFLVLEDRFECWLLNPRDVKRVPGRKSDVTDAQWISRMAQLGLVEPSFVPDLPVRELRDLTRYRTNVVRDRTRAVQRLQDLLESAGIKLSSTVSDITGKSATAMIQALIDDPESVAKNPGKVANDLALRAMRNKIPELTDALIGRFTDHHGRMAATMLKQIRDLDAVIAELDKQIEDEVAPFERVVEHLKTIPGVSDRAAAIIVSEIGIDMSRFRGSDQLASWAGLCPGNNESAGRHLSTRIRKGNRALRAVLFECASSASRTQGTYLSAKYHDLHGRMKATKALVALSRIILETCHHLIVKDTDYKDLGPTYWTSTAGATWTRTASAGPATCWRITATPSRRPSPDLGGGSPNNCTHAHQPARTSRQATQTRP